MAIGLPLGQAFQLADDLLDVIGSSRSTGKPVGGDIREGKRTVLLADAISGADQRQRRTLIDIHPDHQSVEFSPTYVLEMPFSSRKNLTIQP